MFVLQKKSGKVNKNMQNIQIFRAIYVAKHIIFVFIKISHLETFVQFAVFQWTVVTLFTLLFYIYTREKLPITFPSFATLLHRNFIGTSPKNNRRKTEGRQKKRFRNFGAISPSKKKVFSQKISFYLRIYFFFTNFAPDYACLTGDMVNSALCTAQTIA